MKENLRQKLLSCETDVDGALRRFYGNEELYLSLLEAFLSDPTMNQLNDAITQEDWDSAFMAAHALKGLAGNLGFVPLFHYLGELILVLRAKELHEIPLKYLAVKKSYWNILAVSNLIL